MNQPRVVLTMPERNGRWPRAYLRCALLAAALLLAAVPLRAQVAAPDSVRLTLEEALGRAVGESEQVVIAEATVEQSRGNVLRARAARLPQLSGSASYQRALASQFEGVFGGGAPDTLAPPLCPPFTADPALPVEQRVSLLEGQFGCSAGSPLGGIDFSNAGFGAENTYNFGLSLSWPVFTGGRIAAQERVARAGRDAALIGLNSAQAQLRLDVTQAYFNAQLADQLVEITAATVAQADTTLRLTEIGERVGQQAEFDVLRARVARDNLVPSLIQNRAQRDLAYDRLLLLLNLPLDQPLALTTLLDELTAPPDTAVLDSLLALRAPVRQAAEQVAVQAGQLRIAQAQRLPNLSLGSQYGQIAFSSGAGLPALNSFRDNWTVSAAIQVPIFTGGRIRGDVLSAEAGVVQARAQLQQVRELATLDSRNALAQLRAARAVFSASSGTVEQAERAYSIAELRFREGLSNLTELNESRLLLQQARTNRASAARDLQVAQTRVELLPYLPIATPSGVGTSANAGVPNGAGNSSAAETQTQQPEVTTQQGAGAPQGAGVTPR